MSKTRQAPRDPVLSWLTSAENPVARYLTMRDLVPTRPSQAELARLKGDALNWGSLRQLLSLQQADGSFPYRTKTPTAQPTFSALAIMARCGLDVDDEPVARTLNYLTENHLKEGAFSYQGRSGSGVLPCYVGEVALALIRMGGCRLPVVNDLVQWILDYQRFDHKDTRAGGEKKWPYKAVDNHGGCWWSVSCYHGVALTFRALAAIPPEERSPEVRGRLAAALEYLRIHRGYKRTSVEKPLFRHLTRFFFAGDYRSHLIDILEGVADADPGLAAEDWVQQAITAAEALTESGKVPLVTNYAKALMDPLPFETVGEPSRFLTLQWLQVLRKLEGGKLYSAR